MSEGDRMDDVRVTAAVTDKNGVSRSGDMESWVDEWSEVPLKIGRTESAIAAGFRMGWMDGKNDTESVDLACGAGMGSKWGVFTFERGDERIEFVFDAGELVETLAQQAREYLDGVKEAASPSPASE